MNSGPLPRDLRGHPSPIFGQVLGTDILLLSKEILDEVLTTLAEKFSRDTEALSHTAVVLTEMAAIVKPRTRVWVLRDDPDNRGLECAEAGRADLIVTGDTRMLALKDYCGIRIVSLRDLINRDTDWTSNVDKLLILRRLGGPFTA